MTADAIDTNIVLRYILGDVPEQRQKVAEFLRESKTTHYLDSKVILECIYVMEVALEMSREEVEGLLSLFLTRYSDVLEYDRKVIAIALPCYLAHSKLSWVDCALAAEAETRLRKPLLTFDRKLASQLPQARLLV